MSLIHIQTGYRRAARVPISQVPRARLGGKKQNGGNHGKQKRYARTEPRCKQPTWCSQSSQLDENHSCVHDVNR